MIVKLKKDEFTGFDIEVEVPEGVFKMDCFNPMTKESYVKYYYFEGIKMREVKVEYIS